MASPLITLTSDFGTADSYVAAMKGVILGINPRAVIVDVSHDVPPQDIRYGAFVLGNAYKWFPQSAIHVAVVDPGVGTRRRGIALRSPQGLFVAPDNGVLSFVIRDVLGGSSHAADAAFGAVYEQPMGGGLSAVALTEPRFWRHPVSRTFHGRDIFAPVAAHLSLGVDVSLLGKAADSLKCLHIPSPRREGRAVVGHLLHIDRFGNLITTLRDEDLPGSDVEIYVLGRSIRGLSRAYAEGSELLVIVGSSGYVEVSVRNGNAAALLKAKVGDVVTARTPST